MDVGQTSGGPEGGTGRRHSEGEVVRVGQGVVNDATLVLGGLTILGELAAQHRGDGEQDGCQVEASVARVVEVERVQGQSGMGPMQREHGGVEQGVERVQHGELRRVLEVATGGSRGHASGSSTGNAVPRLLARSVATCWRKLGPSMSMRTACMARRSRMAAASVASPR